MRVTVSTCYANQLSSIQWSSSFDFKVHGWKYRRDVIAELPQRTPKDEFDFTTTKINQNFSNYSAWHYRSKLLLTTFTTAEEQQNAVQHGWFSWLARVSVPLTARVPVWFTKRIVLDLEIVRNAVYTEPADQSAWLYQRWLLGKSTHSHRHGKSFANP